MHAMVERDIKSKSQISKATSEMLLVLWYAPMLTHGTLHAILSTARATAQMQQGRPCRVTDPYSAPE